MVALIVFGPRKIPELARKAGKILAEFKKVSSDFRATWEDEVNLTADEQSALDFSDRSIAREKTPVIAEKTLESPDEAIDGNDFQDVSTSNSEENTSELPEIRELTDTSAIEALKNPAFNTGDDVSEKKNWL